MDPSCTIGFYSRSVQDYERISQELSKVRKADPLKNNVTTITISVIILTPSIMVCVSVLEVDQQVAPFSHESDSVLTCLSYQSVCYVDVVRHSLPSWKLSCLCLWDSISMLHYFCVLKSIRFSGCNLRENIPHGMFRVKTQGRLLWNVQCGVNLALLWNIGLLLFQVLQPTAKDKYPAFTLVQGHGRDYELSAGLTPEKREWPFIRDPKRTVTTAGDFVLLWLHWLKAYWTVNFLILGMKHLSIQSLVSENAVTLKVLKLFKTTVILFIHPGNFVA